MREETDALARYIALRYSSPDWTKERIYRDILKTTAGSDGRCLVCEVFHTPEFAEKVVVQVVANLMSGREI